MSMSLNKNAKSQPQRAAELCGSFGHLVLALELTIHNFPPLLRRSAEVGHVWRVSVWGGLERPSHEGVEVKPGLCWKPKDAGGGSGGIPAEESCRVSNRKGVGGSELGVCFAGFWSWFASVFSHYVLFLPPFGMLMYILCSYMLEVCDPVFDFNRALQLRECCQFQETFDN